MAQDDDGDRQFEDPATPAAVGAPTRSLFRPLADALAALAGAVGKLLITIWRLAGALDAALWHGFRLIVMSIVQGFAAMAIAVFDGVRELLGWLPTRAGRAYAAISGVVLIICGLWIADELRRAPTEGGEARLNARAPVDLRDPILARMEGRYIHLSEVEADARASGQLGDDETLTPIAAFERGFVKDYVERRMLSRAAQAENISKDRKVAARLAAARDRILAAAFIEQRVATAVTEEKVRALYDGQKDVVRLGDEVRAKHIVVTTEEEAREIYDMLMKGADFAALARERSIDRATAPLGGEIGYFTKDMMTPALARAAFDTAVGGYAQIFFTEFGWHILKVVDRRPSQSVSFAAVKDNIERFLALGAIEQTVSGLKASLDVTFFPPAPIASGGEAEAASEASEAFGADGGASGR